MSSCAAGPVYVKRSQYTAVCDSVRSKQEDILQYVCDIDVDNSNILDWRFNIFDGEEKG